NGVRQRCLKLLSMDMWTIMEVRKFGNKQISKSSKVSNEHRSRTPGARQRAPTADPGMAEGAGGPLSAPGRRRSGHRRRLWGPHRRQARGQPADRERTPQGVVAGRVAALQTDQAMDLLSAR